MTTTATQEGLAAIAPIRTGDPTRSDVGLRSVTVIVPTRNESANVGPLVARVKAAMVTTDWRWEVLFVDDSDDDTPNAVAILGQAGEPVRLSWRPPAERSGGLSGAVIAGFAAARGDVFVVIDGDLQHPPELLPALLARLADSSADVVVATRYAGDGAGTAGLAGGYRRLVSTGGRRAVHLMFGRARSVSDPLGGFFCVRRSVVEHANLRPEGFKILLEILVRGRWTAVAEVPYRFAARATGESKAGWREGVRFARHVARLKATILFSGREAAR
jgi:glycosyltransferase involved in cell wall biosynthesis